MNPGTLLGPYEIVAKIGAGGMGEVYRARDPRLGREVAVKTLSDSYARDPERRSRLEREARLLAALNHPHIGAIYGIEETAEATALVLELVEGETLQEVIRGHASRGRPMPLEEVVALASQVAEAVEAAHEKGILHRDLKPANVKVTAQGVVKVLDFGLGRASLPGPETSRDPTLTSDGTSPGTVLGTAAYMSPEQARGAPVDRRTDVWSFGCVLYEMLSGSRAFEGASFSDTLVEVFTREPDWTRLPATTPSSIRRLLGRCLRKDPRLRQRDIGDARLELLDALGNPEPLASPPSARRPEVHLLRLTDSGGMVGAPALSPDGKMVAFVAVAEGRKQIFIRLLAGGAPLQVTRDPADHEEPRWMPDSSALVYYTPSASGAGGTLWQVSALGGPARPIAESVGGGDVSHCGRRLAFFKRSDENLALVVAALDGTGARTVQVIPPFFWCDQPRWSPDDRRLAYHRATVFFDTRLEVVDEAGGDPRTVVRAGWLRGHAWLPDGRGLVYSTSKGSTMAYPPTNNLRRVSADGRDDRPLSFGDESYLEPDVDGAGRLVASRVRSRSDVWRIPIDGPPADNVKNATRITRQTGQVQVPAVSPDGRSLVYLSDNGGHANLWVSTAEGAGARQITFESDPAVGIGLATWSPGGQQILFLRIRNAEFEICTVERDGSGLRVLVKDAYAPCWSADGRWVYVTRQAGAIERVDPATGEAVTAQSTRSVGPTAPRTVDVLYFTRPTALRWGLIGDSEICRAQPPDAEPVVLARVANSRVPLAPRIHLHVTASPDDRYLAHPLVDGTTTNLWLIPTDGAPMRAVTDFGDRSVSIARAVSWTPDSRSIYAAVADNDADVVLFENALD